MTLEQEFMKVWRLEKEFMKKWRMDRSLSRGRVIRRLTLEVLGRGSKGL